MKNLKKKHREAAMSLWLVVPAIGLLGVALAAGLRFLKMGALFDQMLMSWFANAGLSSAEIPLNPWIIWGGATLLAMALSAAILNTAGWWRRWFIWMMTLALTVSWVPVLLLASHKAEIGVAVTAVLWSGCCAMFYAFSHEMPADVAEKESIKTNHGAR